MVDENFVMDYDNGYDSSFSLPMRIQGTTTSPQTPNQITELGLRLNSGMRNVEMGTIQPEMFDSIPKQHMEEMRRLAKLTDSKISVHAPMIDPAGFTEQGWNEELRIENEARIKSVMERAHVLDPTGNIPVTIHTTGAMIPEGMVRKKDGEEVREMMVAIEQETGRQVHLRREELDYVGGKKIYTPEDRLDMLNRTSWDEEKLKLLGYQKSKQEIDLMSQRIQLENPQFLELSIKAKEGTLKKEEEGAYRNMVEQIKINESHKSEYDQHLLNGLNNLHHKYSKYKFEKEGISPQEKKMLQENLTSLRKAVNKQTEEGAKLREAAIKNKISIKEYYKGMDKVEKIVTPDQMLSVLSHLPAPQTYKSADDFTIEKTAETFSNVALDSYKKYGNNAPIISMENVFPGTVMSRAESVKKAVKESRKLFAEKLMKEKKVSKEQAEKTAEKMIGVTWDVSHINLLRKHGYDSKDIAKEAEKIAPYVKHVHIADNFGFSDSHLAPGMGNVPIKEELAAMEKKLGKEKMESIRHIVEAGAFAGQFKQSPIPYQLSELNSPLYSIGQQPAWSDMRELYASYMVGYGQQFLPQTHYQMSGAGFSANIPRELGGMAPGTQSRFSGTPNQ
ncbi:MAG: hypothetical protein ABIH25_00930 [Candidatus Woesearchaeota archaeon]